MADIVNSACSGSISEIPGSNASFINLVNTFFAAQCNLFSSDEYPTDYGDKLKSEEEFDFIIIGAGSAGSVVASRLSENSRWKILVLEAGGDPNFVSNIPGFAYTSRNTVRDWNYTNERNGLSCLGMIEGKCSFPRGKVLGGSSSLNLMYYIRGNHEDYNEWESLGNKGWGYRDVLKYFKKSEKLSGFALLEDKKYESLIKSRRSRWELSKYASEKYHSDKGMQGVMHFGKDETSAIVENSILDAAQELGYSYLPDVNGKTQMGFTDSQGTVLNAKRADTARMFLNPIKDRPNLFVVKHAIAEKLLLKDKKVVGVEFVRKGTRKQMMAKNEVIVSAGAANTPKLLILSGIGPKEHLESLGIPVLHDLKGVGENLQDHLNGYGGTVAVHKMDDDPPQNSDIRSLMNLYRYFVERNGTYSTIGVDVVGFLDTLHNSSVPDIQLIFARFGKNASSQIQFQFDLYRFSQDVIDAYIDMKRDHDILLIRPTTTRVKSRGQLRLRSSDPNDPPKLITNFLDNQDDLDVLIRGYEIVEKFVETSAFQNQLQAELMELKIRDCTGFAFKSKEYWECIIRHTTISLYHICCTCKMGPENDSLAVVDSTLKVHGVENLRIVDASIMPLVTRGNTNAPTIMIGEKASDLIKNDYRTRRKHPRGRKVRVREVLTKRRGGGRK